MNKKDLPIAVLKVVEQFDNRRDPLYRRIDGNKDYLVKFVDSDANSDFFFQVTKYDNIQGSLKFILKYKPQSEQSNEVGAISINGLKIGTYFDTWVNRLRHYSKNNSPFESDPILKQYQTEFFSEYELIDEDANTASYNVHQQLMIDAFLEQVNTILEETKTVESTKQVEEIQSEVTELRNTQSRLTKKMVYEKMGKIAAKIRKYGIPAFKEFSKIVTKAVVDWGIRHWLH